MKFKNFLQVDFICPLSVYLRKQNFETASHDFKSI